MALGTIAIWDLWKLVVALWGMRMLLRCAVTWVTASASVDWRVAAWRCQWELLGFLAATLVGATSLQLAFAPGPEPDRLWPLALVLLGLRAALDIVPLLRICRQRIEGALRWRRFLLRLWRRKRLQQGLRAALDTEHRDTSSRRIDRGQSLPPLRDDSPPPGG